MVKKRFKRKLILISGLGCTGKTTLSKHLFEEKFPMFLVSRDEMKELLFDNLGWKDREWSKKLGVASYRLLFHLMDSFFRTGDLLAIESNFNPKFDTENFLKLKEKYGLELIQIICKTEGQVLWERFKQRSESGERHPGHRDHLNYEEFKDTLLKGVYDPLHVEGPILEVDTTDFKKIDYQRIYDFLADLT